MAPLTIFGDFDQDGRISRKQAEQDRKDLFPGLIVLPNLDADTRRLPRNVAASRAVPLDHTRSRSGVDREGARIVVRVDEPDARRVRFEITGDAADHLVLIDRRHRVLKRTGGHMDHEIGPGDHVFFVEATTLRGSPHASPADRAALPGQFDVRVTVAAEDGTELAVETFTGTLAPWIILDNLLPPLRLYMCEIGEEERNDRGNLPSVVEVGDLVRRLGVAFMPIPHAVNNGDAWIQDQFQLGLCGRPGQQLSMIVHLPRLRSNVVRSDLRSNLAALVPAHFPSIDLGLFEEFYTRRIGQATDLSGTRRTFLFRDTFELSMRLGRLWDLWSMIGNFYFVHEFDKKPRDGEIESLLAALPTMPFSRARIKVISTVRRLRRVLDLRADKALKEGQKESLEQQRALLSDQLSLVGKTIIVAPGMALGHMQVPTDAFGDLIFRDSEIDEFDANLIGKHGSLNFGGNLEVSPPLRDAPLGKIAFGANLDNRRTADPDLVHFLERQGAQQVVDIETAWLDVAHVDELMAFLPAPNLSSGAAIAVASPELGMKIIDTAFAVYMEGGGTMAVAAGTDENRPHPALRDRNEDGSSPITRMLRGRYWLHHLPKDAFLHLEPPQIYRDMVTHYPVHFHLLQNGTEVISYNAEPGQDRYYDAAISIREMRYFGRFTNDWLAENKFTALRGRLERSFPGLPLVEIPVLYDEVAWREDPDTKEIRPDFERHQTSAFLPNGANMQILGSNIMVPRPYGPRAAPEVAARILKRAAPAFQSLFSADAFLSRGLDQVLHWAKRPIYSGASGSDLGRITGQFRDGFPRMEEAEIQDLILKANKLRFGKRPNPADGLADLNEGWQRLWIPEGTVDLVEAFIRLRLEMLGLTVHFVDTWYYHIRLGEVHCGTNVLRAAPRKLPRWWELPEESHLR